MAGLMSLPAMSGDFIAGRQGRGAEFGVENLAALAYTRLNSQK